MKEIKTIIAAYHSTDHSEEKLALATVVRVKGSSYRRVGARMLVSENGHFFGGISGGCLEGDALRRAQKAIVFNRPSIVTYDTTQDDGHQIGVGLGCNGIIDVLFTPINPEDHLNPVKILESVVGARYPRVLVTITDTADPDLLGKSLLYVSEDDFCKNFPIQEICGRVLLEIGRSLEEELSRSLLLTENDRESRILIELIAPVQRLIIFGGNYDILPLIRISKELGWDVAVVANIHKINKDLFELADSVIHSGKDEALDVDRYTACLLMAHDLETDFKNFRNVLKTRAGYIGLLGPRKRAEKIFNRLQEVDEAVTEEEARRIFAPAGLDIGAVTPEEIALSIVAEVRSHFAGRNGQSLRGRQGSIHGNPIL